MEFYVNGTKIDVELENEKTIGDVLRGFEEECAKSNATTVSIIVDGKNISAEDFDKTAEKPLCPDTKIELGIISQEAIENSFNEEKESCRKLSEELKQIPVKFQAGKDNEANYLKVGKTFIPADGEVCLVSTEIYGVRQKIGDGKTSFEALPYLDENNNVVLIGYYFNEKFYTDSTYTKELMVGETHIYLDK